MGDDGPTGDGTMGTEGGTWINVVAADGGDNQAACAGHTGEPCGFSATPNPSAGFTCGCREGTWAQPWTCGGPDAAVVSGPQCPGSGDAGSE
jgi:hypothetical protein